MKRYLLFIIACMCMSFSCVPQEDENYHRKVKVTNNTDYPIYVVGNYLYPHEYYEPEYPWNPNENKIGGIGKSENRVNPGETNTTAINAGRPSNSIEGDLLYFNYIKVFFIDATLYDQTPIGSPIPVEVLLDSRIYDVEDLRAINFHINYPLD